MTLKTIAIRIQERRKALNLRQGDLAEHSHTTQAQISRYEKGENDPTSDMIVSLAQALDVSTDWLLGVTDSLVNSGPELSELEQEILEVVRAKSPNEQQKIRDIIRLL